MNHNKQLWWVLQFLQIIPSSVKERELQTQVIKMQQWYEAKNPVQHVI